VAEHVLHAPEASASEHSLSVVMVEVLRSASRRRARVAFPSPERA
jgi:hypothetical protein